MFYDYFLVNSWREWSTEPFADYLDRTRGVVENCRNELPPAMQPLLPIIFGELLPSYGSLEGIGSALGRLSRRLKRPNPLAGGVAELRRHREELQKDFLSFTPDIISFAAATIAASNEK
jgi:acyl carrier protein phosphodiesterase